jgi:2-dehydropantoate 2-reductase
MTSSDPSSPSIAVIGAGGIGGCVAARLALAGRQVRLCARRPFDALVLEEGGERREAPVTVATDPAEAGRADWVMLATKAQDTQDAAPWLARLCDRATTLVVLQNGIDHEARVAPIANSANVLPAVVYIGAERVAPGHVVQHGGGTLVVPEGEAAGDLACLFQGSGIVVEGTADFLSVAWRKILGNIIGNPITALTLRRMEVFREPAIRELAVALVEEAMAVGRACGASFADGTVAGVVGALVAYNPQGGSSMLYDRLAGRRLEHEHLTGAVVRAADAHGIAVPLNRAVLALLSALDAAPAASG